MTGATRDEVDAGGPGVGAVGGNGARRRRAREHLQPARVVPLAVAVGGGIVLSHATLAVLARLRSILVLLLLSLFLSFALEPAVQWMHARGVRRGLGTGIAFLVTAVLAVVFVLSFSGLVSSQVSSLVENAPGLLDELATQAERLPEEVAGPVTEALNEQSGALSQRASAVAGELGRRVLGVGSTIVGGLFSLATVGLITFYLVADGPMLRRTLLRRLQPERQRELDALWELAIAKTGGYVYSRAVLAVVSAVVHGVAFSLLGLPYAAALGVWMGLVSSVVPVVGTYLAAAVPVLVAVAEPEVSVIAILVVVTVYQQLENYLVHPRVTAHSLELHPAVAFVSVLVGAALLGAVGALLALPVTAIVAALLSTSADEYDPDRGHDPAGVDDDADEGGGDLEQDGDVAEDHHVVGGADSGGGAGSA